VALVRQFTVGVSRLVAASLALVAVCPVGACRRSRLSRGDAAPVVVVALRNDVHPARSLEEREPNDSPDKAQLLVLDPDRTVIDLEGTLTGQTTAMGSDVDVFKLLIPGAEPSHDRPGAALDSASPEDPRFAARRLTLEIAPEGAGSVGFQALDEGLKILEAVSAQNGHAAGMPNLAVQPGRAYYLRVKALSKSGKPGEPSSICKYKLSLQLGDFEVADEREPNDSSDAAEPLAMAGLAELAGFHGWPHDQDFYRVPAPDIASALEVVLDGVEGVTPGLSVLDGNGSRLAIARGRRGERLALHNVRIGAAAVDAGGGSPFFYVVVRSEAGQNRTQRYILHLALGALKPGLEVEPNDTPASATPVREDAISGFLSDGDVDYFVYGGGGGAREINVEVSFPAHVRGRLEVVRMGRAGIVASAEAKKAHRQVTLPKVANSGEPLLLRVALAKGEGNAGQPYVLKITDVISAGPGQVPQIHVSH
jgi:hypothetical protein